MSHHDTPPPTYSQADMRNVNKPDAYIALYEKLTLGIQALNKYVDSQVLPGNTYEQWVNPNVTIFGSTVLEDNLGFQAHTLIIDNYSGQWVRVNNRFIPKLSIGWVLNVPVPYSKLTVEALAPPGAVNTAPVTGELVWVSALEANIPNSPGMPFTRT